MIMRAVDQTVISIGNPRANCFQACLAMVTGFDIEDCIDITDPEIEPKWPEHAFRWLNEQGFDVQTTLIRPQGFYIAVGPTEHRQGDHAVVCDGEEMFHDPHLSRDGITGARYFLKITKSTYTKGATE